MTSLRLEETRNTDWQGRCLQTFCLPVNGNMEGFEFTHMAFDVVDHGGCVGRRVEFVGNMMFSEIKIGKTGLLEAFPG